MIVISMMSAEYTNSLSQFRSAEYAVVAMLWENFEQNIRRFRSF